MASMSNKHNTGEDHLQHSRFQGDAGESYRQWRRALLAMASKDADKSGSTLVDNLIGIDMGGPTMLMHLPCQMQTLLMDAVTHVILSSSVRHSGEEGLELHEVVPLVLALVLDAQLLT